MNPFPHQQRADRSLRPGARTLRSWHSVLVQIAGNGVRRLALRALPHNAGHHVLWRPLRDSGGTAPDTPSSASHVISQPLVSATRSTARSWTSMLMPLLAGLRKA